MKTFVIAVLAALALQVMASILLLIALGFYLARKRK